MQQDGIKLTLSALKLFSRLQFSPTSMMRAQFNQRAAISVVFKGQF